jgi:hypothetical protein
MALSVASNLGILSFSRMMGLDAALKMIRDTHTMIGAPKKKTENVEEKPLEALADWLNGKDVPGLPFGADVQGIEEVDSDRVEDGDDAETPEEEVSSPTEAEE